MSRSELYCRRIKELLDEGAISLSLHDIDPTTRFLEAYEDDDRELETAIDKILDQLDAYVKNLIMFIIDDYDLEIYSEDDSVPTIYTLRTKRK
jgi:hypothetical protein